MPSVARQVSHLELPCGRIAVERLEPEGAPSRPVLIFLHEALGSITQWRGFPARVAATTGLAAVVYDRLGFGRSDPWEEIPRPVRYLHDEAEISLPALLATCGVSEPILFGHSDGGTIALLYAAAFPGTPRGVVTEAAHVFVEEETRAGVEAALEAWKSADLKPRLARHHGEKTDTVFAAWWKTWLSPVFRSWDIRPELGAITCPLLVLQGADDVYGTPAQVDAIVRGVSGPATPMVLPGCGHTPHREAEDAVLRETERFLSSLAPRG